MHDPGPDFIKGITPIQLEALVETMYLVAFADGKYDPNEQRHFARCLDGLTGGQVDKNAFVHLIAQLVERVASEGRAGIISSIKSRLDSPELRQIALILAGDMAAADGVLHPNERSFIAALAQAFGMNDAATQEVFDGPCL